MTNSQNRTPGGRNSERNNGSPQPQNTGGYYANQRKNSRGQQKSPSSAIFFQRNHSISPTLANSSPSKFGRADTIQTTPNYHQQQQQQQQQHHNTRQTPPMPIAIGQQQHHHHHHHYNNSNQQQHYNNHFNQHRASPGSSHSAASSTSSSPPNIALFAGSKCYDAPAPTALPRPPSHWTSSNGGSSRGSSTGSCSLAAAFGRSAKSIGGHAMSHDFTQNLKMLLNVSA